MTRTNINIINAFLILCMFHCAEAQTPRKVNARPDPNISAVFKTFNFIKINFRSLKNESDVLMPFGLGRGALSEAVRARGSESGELADLFRSQAPLLAVVAKDESEVDHFVNAFKALHNDADWKDLKLNFLTSFLTEYADFEKNNPDWSSLELVRHERVLTLFSGWIAAVHDADDNVIKKIPSNWKIRSQRALSVIDSGLFKLRVKIIETAMQSPGSWEKFLNWVEN